MLRLTLPRIHAKSAKERIIRSLAMVLVFALVAWAFTKNNERLIERLNKDTVVLDETGTMTDRDKEFLMGFVQSVDKQYGIPVRIKAYKEAIVPPAKDSKTLFIGISPSKREIVMHIPMLLRAPLDKAFIKRVEDEHFTNSFEDGKWVRELTVLTTMIWSRLLAMDSETNSTAE